MNIHAAVLDLAPPPFSEGLDDWSRGDGTPDTPSYAGSGDARIASGDPDFGTCLELRKTEPVQRLRYMGEVPVRAGRFLEIAVRLKGMRGPLPMAQIAALPGAMHGRTLAGLPTDGPARGFGRHGAILRLRAVIGPEPLAGVDLVWDSRAMYAHVGIDLVGLNGGVVRVEDIAVRDVTGRFSPSGPILPGFSPTTAP